MADRTFLDFRYVPERYRGYMDFFSDDITQKEPVILADGTSVLFPNYWTDEDADKWRKEVGLQRPRQFAPSYGLH